jgi:hypothetical protein
MNVFFFSVSQCIAIHPIFNPPFSFVVSPDKLKRTPHPRKQFASIEVQSAA